MHQQLMNESHSIEHTESLSSKPAALRSSEIQIQSYRDARPPYRDTRIEKQKLRQTLTEADKMLGVWDYTTRLFTRFLLTLFVLVARMGKLHLHTHSL